MEMNDKRWKSLKDITIGGIVVVRDGNPSEPIELVQPVAGNLIYYNYVVRPHLES